MDNSKQNAEKIYEIQNKYFQIRESASESEILALAEESYSLGSNGIYELIAVSAPQDTLDQLEKKLEYCSLAEQHGVDIKNIKEITLELIAVSAPQDTLDQLEKKLEYCSLAEQHGVDVKNIKELVNDLIEMKKRELDAPVVMTPEVSANMLWEAQQIAMELAKAQGTNTLWTCSYCNTPNTGRFCQNCGAPRP